MKNTIIDYMSYLLFLFIIIGWAIVLFLGLRHMDEKRQKDASAARKEVAAKKATTDKQNAIDASDRLSGIQRVYWDDQETGFRDVPVQAAY